jgi:hypothetical protein
MRKRYFPRSAPDIRDHTRVYAVRAAATARSTSSAARLGDLGEHLLGGRVDRLEGVPPVAGDELAVDEQAVAARDVDDGGVTRGPVRSRREHGSGSVVLWARREGQYRLGESSAT